MKLIDFMKLQKSASVCCLCTESLNSENATPSCCEHVFHIDCLKKWTEEHKSESHCRCPIETCGRTYTAMSIRSSIGGSIRENISLAVDSQCPICCEEIQPPVAVPESCNHHFCVTCLSEWAKVRHECPLDRGPFELMLLSSYIGGPIIERRPPPPALVPPLEEEDTTECEICHSPEDEACLLLCDGCDKGYHTYCLPNPLSEIPEGDWFCPNCECERVQTQQGENSLATMHSRHSGRQSHFRHLPVDLSAEEISRSEESEDDEVEDIGSCFYLSTQSQERLTHIAERRHRGTGLLRDLIEQLSVRAEREQQERRRNRRRRQRRRVHLAESFSEPQLSGRNVTSLPSLSRLDPLQGAAATTSTNKENSGRIRKRRRVVGFTSSDSEEGEETLSPASPLRTRKREGCFSPSPSSSHQRLQSTPVHDFHERSSHHIVSSKSTESGVVGPSNGRADDSSRDIFASFTTDPNVSIVVEELQDIVSKEKEKQPGCSGSRIGKRRLRRRNIKRKPKTADRSLVLRARGSIRRSQASVTRKTPMNKGKKGKRLRLSSSQKRIQSSLTSLISPSTSTRSGRMGRRSNLKLPTPKLSVLGNELDCGLLSDLKDDGDKERPGPTFSTRTGITAPTSSASVGLLSRLEAAQSSLFQFRISNMRVNPDNSLSPIEIAPSSQSRLSKNASSIISEQSPPSVRLVAKVNGTRAITSSGLPSTKLSKSSAPLEEKLAKPSTSSTSSTSTWTSEEALRVRTLLVAHLLRTHPSLTDKATKMRLIQRSLSKILSKKPNRVTEEKMKKLVDDYVEFYRRNPL
ncbi:PHD and RING finger domain-containing protein 1 [Taenia solium]|eukprot:TsM_000454100 transcript=TsM_000454100 gene=TsM_000454100